MIAAHPPGGVADASACDYCGLPLTASLRSAPAPRYCCFGCRLAAQITRAQGETGAARWLMVRLGLAAFFSMNVMVFTLALWSQDIYATGGEPASDAFYNLLRYGGLLFSLPVVLLLGEPLAEAAAADLRRGRPTTELLLTVGVGAALVYSLASVLQGGGHVYFEVACMVLLAVTLGKYLEATGKLHTTAALRSLARLLPRTVRRLDPTGQGGSAEVELEQVAAGDWLHVLPGERIAVDGVVARGRAAVDQQVVTGESHPLVKQPGDTVLSGALCLDGELVIAATAPPGRGALQQLIDAVAAAATQQDRTQRLADRITAWFLPAVMLLAVGSLVARLAAGAGVDAWLISLSIVLIACPCALGLATPLALWGALGAASRRQVLVCRGDALSDLAAARLICFDKTGTLTTGQPAVEQLVIAPGEDRDAVERASWLLAARSRHPLAVALAEFVDEDLFDQQELVEFHAESGGGLTGRRPGDDGPRWLGSRRWLAEAGLAVGPELAATLADPRHAGLAHVLVGWNGRVRGVWLLREALRPEAADVVAQLQQLGRRVVILSGDRPERVARLAAELNVEAVGGLLPAEKLAHIDRWRRQGQRVAMVGDGLNDAPALAAADVGLALGGGADASRELADVCLLGDDLTRLPWLCDLAARTVRVIRWNLWWAFFYNVLGVGLAVAGWLNPIVAAIAMAVSSVLVVQHSLTLAAEEPESASPGSALTASPEDTMSSSEETSAAAAEPLAVGAGR